MSNKNQQLTEKQQRFVDEYLISLNATQSAIKAGYSKETAYSQGARMLRNVQVQKAIIDAQTVRKEKVEITQEYVLYNLKLIVERCLENEPVRDREGNPTGVYKFNASGATKALELLGKHLAMFTDKIDVKVASHEEALAEIEKIHDRVMETKEHKYH